MLMIRIFIIAGLLFVLPASAQQDVDPPETKTLAELAAAADLVAVVQVADTDYEYVRDFPSGGTAYLRVLIAYKVSTPFDDIVEVYEEGLHPGECYFENPDVNEEGRRHLVFLRTHPTLAGRYQGLDSGCSLDVFVTSDNAYALKYPLSGISLADDVAAHAVAMPFQDSYALISDDELEVPVRNEWLELGLIEPQDELFKFTHGVPLNQVREMMGPDALTLDRTLKQ